MTPEPLPTTEQIDRILAFLPVFEAPGFSAGESVAHAGEFPYCRYSPEVHAFVRALEENNWVVPFDWTSWQEEASRNCRQDPGLGFADLETLRRLLTLHVRKERFCEGNLAGVIASGHIVAVLRRLKAIRTGMEQQNRPAQ